MTRGAVPTPAPKPEPPAPSQTGPQSSVLSPQHSIPFTDAQRKAIRQIDRSVLVSAAAGSGKTAVLAERCAYLVCDAPPAERCDIDQLLVVTFTENAAAEMKSRIRKAIHGRLKAEPGNARLGEQLGLVDAARISTLHAFGLWVLRRWFNQADIDPAAPLLDEHEGVLLRAETLDGLCERLYREDTQTAAAFRDLVEHYGLGHDRGIRRFVLSLAGFLDSLPDPEAWLERAIRLITSDRSVLLERLALVLAEELEGQIEYCQRAATHIAERYADFSFYGGLLEQAAALLSEWRLMLPRDRGGDTLVAGLRRVQAAIAEQKFSTKGSPAVSKDSPEELLERRDRARKLWERFHDGYFKGRLKRVIGHYTPEEWFEGLDRIAPHAAALLEVVRAFRTAYAAAKERDGVLDFADLERRTYALLMGRPEVAAELRQRFRHVLVDEFQDINPLQEAILRLVSREGEPGHAGNLFVVGDVKQSIYRFRLAEPAIFLSRMADLERPETPGMWIALQENFRSEPTILDAVNHLFRRLMTPAMGGIAYDETAELRPGPRAEAERGRAREEGRGSDRQDACPTTHRSPLTTHWTPHSVEVHLLERRLTAGAAEPGDEVDPDDPAEWAAIQREAYLIAERVRAILSEGLTDRDKRPYSYRDVAVLLRAASHAAAPLARMLVACGIPARADVGGEFFSAVEVQDVLSLLAVLDNLQQDIPLAAMLRSPILGDAYNEDQLLELRSVDRAAPFHETVRRYATEGQKTELRERIAATLGRLHRYGDEARQRPLADTLWRLYHDHGYLAWAGGLPNGSARRANLLKLHELARRFGAFQRQGLHRFLRFLDALKAEELDLGSAPGASAVEDVVRVMSIHRSKGLEFPVVFVADLGRRFNLQDAAGAMIYDRDLGLGLSIVDRDRMITYPSLTHFLVAERAHLHTRAEELRVLYVALTRAMRRLVMIGSGELKSTRTDYALHAGHAGPLPPLSVRTAATPLAWVVPALAAMPEGVVEWPGGAARGGSDTGSRAVFTVQLHDKDAMQGWSLEANDSEHERTVRQAAARLEALPAEEPADAPAAVVARVFERIEYVYPHLADASVPAVIAATELAKGRAWMMDEDSAECGVWSAKWGGAISDFGFRISDRERGQQAAVSGQLGPASGAPLSAGGSLTTASAEGVATHRLLQHLDFAVPATVDALRGEMQRLVGLGLIAPDEAKSIDPDSIAWFLGTELAGRIRAAGAGYRRELMFVRKRVQEPSPGVASVVGAPSPKSSGAAQAAKAPDPLSFSLVRGVIDGVLRTDTGLEIVDYKTDRVAAAEVSERAAYYAPQLEIYAGAAEALYRKPVTTKWLVFLHPRQIAQV